MVVHESKLFRASRSADVGERRERVSDLRGAHWLALDAQLLVNGGDLLVQGGGRQGILVDLTGLDVVLISDTQTN